MDGFDFWQVGRRTSELYLRTNRQDWFDSVDKIVKEIGKRKKILDIGSGDGHSTRQILSRLSQGYFCDLLEPNLKALKLSKELLKEFHEIQFYLNTLDKFIQKGKKYDLACAIHSNYYWGKIKNRKEQSLEQYKNCLDGIIELAPKILILTQPSNSDYFEICNKNIFPDWVFAEYILQYCQEKGIAVRQEPCPMRFYINDLHKDWYAAKEVWKFFNDTEREPTPKQIDIFLNRITKTQKEGNLNFRDVLLIIQ